MDEWNGILRDPKCPIFFFRKSFRSIPFTWNFLLGVEMQMVLINSLPELEVSCVPLRICRAFALEAVIRK